MHEFESRYRSDKTENKQKEVVKVTHTRTHTWPNVDVEQLNLLYLFALKVNFGLFR